jgi:hypothetical protein
MGTRGSEALIKHCVKNGLYVSAQNEAEEASRKLTDVELQDLLKKNLLEKKFIYTEDILNTLLNMELPADDIELLLKICLKHVSINDSIILKLKRVLNDMS